MTRCPANRVYRLIQDALAGLPKQYAERLENVDFRVLRAPSRIDRKRLGLGREDLYGLYEGIPLTRRGEFYDRVIPDRITLYWGTLIRDYPEDEALAEQVKKTVYHEIGHYFGLDEEDLHGTSVG